MKGYQYFVAFAYEQAGVTKFDNAIMTMKEPLLGMASISNAQTQIQYELFKTIPHNDANPIKIILLSPPSFIGEQELAQTEEKENLTETVKESEIV